MESLWTETLRLYIRHTISPDGRDTFESMNPRPNLQKPCSVLPAARLATRCWIWAAAGALC